MQANPNSTRAQPPQDTRSRFDFRQRASLTAYPELMDQPASYADLRACLRDIARVNTLLRAHHPTLAFLDRFLAQVDRPRDQPLHIVDVGSGYGDLLRRIDVWARQRQIPVTLTGIDLNPLAIRAARQATPTGNITFLAGNAFDYTPPQGIDLIVSSLTTHHLEEPEIVHLLRWMEASARHGWFINDLHRQPVPHLLFRALRSVMPWHPFVKHDGAVSILRSFRPADWQRLCRAAQLPPGSFQLLTYRPARLCVARLRPMARQGETPAPPHSSDNPQHPSTAPQHPQPLPRTPKPPLQHSSNVPQHS